MKLKNNTRLTFAPKKGEMKLRQTFAPELNRLHHLSALRKLTLHYFGADNSVNKFIFIYNID